jgi:hypothetical protein
MPNYKIEKVTPAKATKWLETNVDNRKIAPTVVSKYALDMKGGHWDVAQPIYFDMNDNLVDGQHRLLAVIEADETIEMTVGRGFDPKIKIVLDTGRRRTFADLLHWMGEKNTNHLAAVVRMSWQWQNEYLYSSKGYGSFSHNGGLDFLNANPSIRKFVGMGAKMRNLLSVPTPVASALAHRIYQIDALEADAFIAQIQLGEGLEQGMPTYAFRQYALNKQARPAESRPGREVYLACMIKAWNAYILGEEIQVMSFRRGGTQKDSFPQLVDPEGVPFPLQDEIKAVAPGMVEEEVE